ncbi:sorbosone dehydrogenase family protein [Cytobacillus depressus]|uniref:Sorbosone dehydrogenase family protein n=1 Tax=Cytobacillus depressus TaxID=1602942 RepID=A0A6L3V4T9_9BACI|nr:sorbosone dehydrogenase family protein [Cytobacillus depressus]KAB2333126.1 sorbosone dehydrogenase family protein [Cytobacillus depressus]
MARLLAFIFLAVIVAAGCSNEEKREVEDKEASVQLSELQVLADELHIPWSISQIGEIFYLTERPGSIVKIEDGKRERQKVMLEKELATAAEAGLLGFVLTPDFLQTNEAFAYYTYKDSSGQFNRIVVLQLENSVWKEKRLLVDKIPSGQYHHGGRMKIGPDGKLYATTGDAATNPEIAQDLQSLGGKILRMNVDGSIPDDNPVPNSYVYSFGHRNPQGLAWTSEGTLYESEHGPSANDEINLIQAGKNYGWPVIKGIEKKAAIESPLFTSGANNTWAPSGMAYANGKLYVAALRGNAIIEFNPQTKEQREIITGLGRIRDVFIEGNSLYFISNNTDGRGNPLEKDDKLYRVELSAQ